MATDFWASSHYKRWIVDRATLKQARSDDLVYVQEPEHLDFLAIYFANIITRLGKKLQLRQRVIATATVFFRRFYLKNAYCETEPFLVISTCIYVAAKAEESPVHIKNVISESRSLFSQHYGVKNFPSDNSKLAEMEFYLVDDLESDLVVYHPYRTLLALCKTGSVDDTQDGEEGEEGEEEEAGELGSSHGAGVGVDEGSRYWGTGEGKLVLSKEALQIAWSIINDTYRSELCLLYPPHLIAIAALYLTFILHPPGRSTSSESTSQTHEDVHDSKRHPRRSSRQASNHSQGTKQTHSKNPDPITFLAQLNVSLPLVATIAQEIISLYTLWEQYKEDGAADAPVASLASSSGKKHANSRSSSNTGFIHSQTAKKTRGSGSGGVHINAVSSEPTAVPVSRASTTVPATSSVPADVVDPDPSKGTTSQPITTAMLSLILVGMREARLLDLAFGGEGELMGFTPSAPSSAPLVGGSGLPLSHPHIGQGHGSSGASSAASSVVNQGAMNVPVVMPPSQYALNKMLERAMHGYR